jgi:ferredoxin-NADP reductase
VLFLCVRSVDDATGLDDLRAAHEDGRIELRVHASSDGNRLDPDRLDELVDGGLVGAHVAVCGPATLVRAVVGAAHAAGAAEVHHEDFDIRQGFGPDLSVEIDDLVASVANRR